MPVCSNYAKNYASIIYKCLHPARAQAPLNLPHVLYKPLPLFAFFCAYEVAQSPHENSMSGANTRSVLVRFGDNNWEKGEDFVNFLRQKTCVEDGGELERARAGWRVKRYDHVAKSELRQNFAKVAKILRLSQKYWKTNPAKLWKNLSTSFCACLVSWKQRNSEVRANIRKSCRRPVVSLLYATKSALTAPNMLGMRTCLPCHIPDRWSRNANWIWPDLAFGFVLKRSGNEITTQTTWVQYL